MTISTLPSSTIKFCGVLLTLQLYRAGLVQLLLRVFSPGSRSTAWDAISLLSFVVPALTVLAVFRPSRAALGFRLADSGSRERMVSLAGMGLVLLLLVIGVVLAPEMALANLSGVLVTPLCEELLFRGWGWNRLRGNPGAPVSLGWVFVILTGLFALWHGGYADMVILRSAALGHGLSSAAGLGRILFYKLLVGGAVGVLTGLARMRSKTIFPGLVLHALWNVFGR